MDEIARQRLHNLRLTGPRLAGADAVLRWLGAVQSQDYGPAKWSIAQRTNGATDESLDRAFADGTVLRTHVLRPTWHFVLPADIRWLLGLTGPRVHTLNAYMYRQTGLDERVRARAAKTIAGALQGGNHLTRQDLTAILDRDGIATDGFRAAYLLMHAELEGVVCSGPLRGRQHTYALLDERAPTADAPAGAPGPSRDEALAELTRRYFTSHGPATAKDFQWWSSLTAREVTRGLDLVGSTLEAETVDGVRYWSVGGRTARRDRARVHLLQGYDEYTVAYSESKFRLDRAGAGKALGQRSLALGAVVADTQLAGRWKRTVRKDGVHLDVVLPAPFDAERTRALAAAADRYATFAGQPASLTVTVL